MRAPALPCPRRRRVAAVLLTDLDELLSRPQDTVPAREKARKTIVERYDLKTICLPKQLELVTPTTPTISQSGHPARPAT